MTLLTVGPLTLDPGSRIVASHRGSTSLDPSTFAVMHRLMRQPGVLISADALVSAMYDDPDREPDNAVTVMRMRINRLRGLLWILTRQEVCIRTEIGVGYVIEERLERSWIKSKATV